MEAGTIAMFKQHQLSRELRRVDHGQVDGISLIWQSWSAHTLWAKGHIPMLYTNKPYVPFYRDYDSTGTEVMLLLLNIENQGQGKEEVG